MIRLLKPWQIALAYVVLSALALGLFATPLWYAWRVNVGTLRVFVPEEMQALPDLFYRSGAGAVAAAVRSRWDATGPEVIVFAGPGKEVIAGTMRRWPTEIPDAPGTYGHVIDLGDGQLTRIVVSHVPLPGDYSLIMGRKSGGLMSLEEHFWYGLAGGMTVVLALGGALAWLLARRGIAARRSEQRYARVLQATSDGIWEWNPATDEIYISERARRLWAVPDGVTVHTRAEAKRVGGFHPEDVMGTEEVIKASRTLGTSGFVMEYRVLQPSGDVRWIRSQGRTFPGADGQPTLVTGSVTDITERKRAELALRRSEERYARAMQASEDGFWEWIVATDEFYASPRMLALYGLPPDTVFRGRKDFLSRRSFHPEDLELWRKGVAAYLSGETVRVDLEVRAQLRDGMGWIHLTAMCLRDAAGREERWTGSVSDVTERRRAQDALRRSEERYSLAMEASEEGHFDVNLDSGEIFVSERLNDIYGFPRGTRFANRAEYLARVRLHPDDIAKYHATLDAALAKNGPERYEFEFRILGPSGDVRWLRTRGKVTRDAEGRARRRTGVVAEITSAKMAEQALRESQLRYERAMLASNAGLWEWDAATDQYFVSARHLELLGFAPGTTFSGSQDFLRRAPFHPDDVEQWQTAVRRLFASGGSHLAMELRVIIGGETRWVLLNAISFRDAAGAVVRMTGFVTDVTERKRAEQALLESQERYALAVAGANEGIWDVDFAGGRVFVSARARELAGMAPGPDVVPLEEWFASLPLHPEDVPRRIAAFQAHLAGETPTYAGEFRLRQPDGTYRWRRLRGLCMRDANGKPYRLAGSIGDIDARKRAEESLRLSEERYALAMEAAGDGHTDWNLVTGEFYISPRLLEILGYPPDATFVDRADWVRRFPFHPEDRPRWEKAVAAHFAGREAKFKMDLRIVVKKEMREEIRWVAFTFVATRDADGRVVRWTGSIADIDDAKRAHEALRETQERYALAVAGSADGVWDINFVTGMHFVSDRGRELAGMPPGPQVVRADEYFAQLPIHPDDVARRHAALQAHLTGNAPAYVGEFRMRQLDGVYRWRRIHGVCVRDASGRPMRMAGSFSDIDARKRAEEALRLSEERYELAMRASGAGHWDWRIESDEFYASPRYLEFGGFPPDMQYSRRSDVVSKIPFHPDDRAKYEAAVAAHFAGETPRVDMVIRVMPHGETCWLHVIGMCLRDAVGKPVRWAGSVTDITARKLAEDALRLSEERYALAMEASEEGHFDWNVPTDEIFASARLMKLLALPADANYRKRADMVSRIPFPAGDREKVARMAREVLAGDALQHEFEYRLVRGDGAEPRWIQARWKIFRDPAGAASRVIGVVTDITARKLAAEELRASEARFRSLLELSTDWYWRQDETLRFAHMSDHAAALGGYTEDSSIGKARWELAGLAPMSGSWEEHQAVLAARQPFRDLELRRVMPDGSVKYLSISGAPIFDAEGTFRGYQGVGRNITERKRIEEELRSRQEMLEVAQKASRAVPWEWRNDADPQANRWSPELEAMFGLPPGGFDGTVEGWWRLCHPDDWPRVKSSIAHAHATGDIDVEYRVIHPDGKVRWLNQKGRTFFGPNGNPMRSIGFMFDVTERRKVEDDLRSRQEMLELAQKAARAVAFEWKIGSGEGENRWSADLEAMYGLAPGTYDGSFESWKKLVYPEDWPTVKDAIKHAHRTGEVSAEYRVVHPDGSVRWLHAKGRMFFDGERKPVRMVGFMQDVTQRRRAEEDLRSRQEMLMLAQQSARAVAFDWRAEREDPWPPELEAMYGVPPGTFPGTFRPFGLERQEWKKLVHPDDWPAVTAAIEHAYSTGDVAAEYRVIHADGSVHWLQSKGRMFFNAEQKPVRMVGLIQDVTQLRHAEQELKALEGKLRQSQRLEAMGTLAGGIAHDFNNILGAILGYGEMALRDAPKGSRLRRDLDSIIVAGERGRALVERVLAFSRSAAGERVAVHVEKAVREALDLVAAKLPPNVTLHAKLHAGRAAVLGDSTQVHQVLSNLATNAIQAMPAGGMLRVSLDTVCIDRPHVVTIGTLAAGEYLVLRVSDTGTGIAPKVLDRIFDPFFTTKEVGKGTGLGLSLVHGIVTDLGGAIDVASTIGTGTSFNVYLPRSGEALDTEDDTEPTAPKGGGQRVLVIDDEEMLVDLATRTLEDLGYVPLGFTSSTAALAAFRADPEGFDAVITDERMPGISGSALIRELRGIRGSIPIVLMSGYVGDATGKGREGAKTPIGLGADEVLQKPLLAHDLATSLARVLQSVSDETMASPARHRH